MICPRCRREVTTLRARILPRDPARPDEVNKIEGCEPCFLELTGPSTGRLSAAHLNQVMTVTKDGDKVTRGFMLDAAENHSFAEVYKDGEIPVSRRAASRRSVWMGRR